MRCVVVVGLLVSGCSLALGGEEPDAGPPVISKVEHKEIPQAVVPRYDLLFVVDSAPTMAAEHEQFASQARAMINTITQIEGGLPDVHIGVVDSNLGTLGVDVGDPACLGDGAGGRLETFGCGGTSAFLAAEIDDWGNRSTNYTGALDDAFACVLTHVGADGCSWRQPLEAMRRALDDGERNGFLRDDAQLFVAFIGDADDCSAASPTLYGPTTPGDPRDPFRCFVHGVVCDGDDPTASGTHTGCRPRDGDPLLVPIETYRDDLVARKANPRDIMVGAVTPAGDVTVVPGPNLADGCHLDALAGTPATRLTSFLVLFPDRNVWTTSCDTDWTDVLVEIAEQLLRPVIGYPCIEGRPVDLDVAEQGEQPDIAVWIQRLYEPTSFVIPDCTEHDASRCYRLVEDRQNCNDTPTGLALTVEPPLFGYPVFLEADIAVE